VKYLYPRIFGLVNLLALASFLVGFFTNTKPATIGGGTIVVLADLIAMWGGFLNPFLPTVLAIIGAIVIRPWYIGVFWASAIFAMLSIPHYLNLLLRPAHVISAGFSKFIGPQILIQVNSMIADVYRNLTGLARQAWEASASVGPEKLVVSIEKNDDALLSLGWHRLTDEITTLQLLVPKLASC